MAAFSESYLWRQLSPMEENASTEEARSKSTRSGSVARRPAARSRSLPFRLSLRSHLIANVSTAVQVGEVNLIQSGITRGQGFVKALA